MMSLKLAYSLAIIGAALWGLVGLFVQNLYAHGLTAWQVVAVRSFFSMLLLLSYLLVWKRQALRIKWRHLPYFIGTGVISFVFFNWCFFKVIEQTNLSLAVMLLYTGPLFVTLISRFLFKEWLTTRKVAAIVVTLLGCSFVVGLLPQGSIVLTASTLLIGIGSGFFYALYSIFAKLSSRYYQPLTITVYSFICSTVFLLFSSNLVQSLPLLLQWDVMLNSLGLAFFSTTLAYILYTKGLSQIESSRAAILSTIEPVIAICVGFFFFHDELTLWQWSGVLLVFISMFLVAETSSSTGERKSLSLKTK